MYKLIDLIGMIDCLVDFGKNAKCQCQMPSQIDIHIPSLSIYIRAFSLNDHASFHSASPFHLPFAPHFQTAVSGHPAAPPTRHRIRGHLTPKKRGAGGDFGLRANPLSRGKLMGVGGDRRSGD